MKHGEPAIAQSRVTKSARSTFRDPRRKTLPGLQLCAVGLVAGVGETDHRQRTKRRNEQKIERQPT